MTKMISKGCNIPEKIDANVLICDVPLSF